MTDPRWLARLPGWESQIRTLLAAYEERALDDVPAVVDQALTLLRQALDGTLSDDAFLAAYRAMVPVMVTELQLWRATCAPDGC